MPITKAEKWLEKRQNQILSRNASATAFETSAYKNDELAWIQDIQRDVIDACADRLDELAFTGKHTILQTRYYYECGKSIRALKEEL